MTNDNNNHTFEKNIHVNISKGMSYADYLQLDKLLSSQPEPSSTAFHDEMLFVLQHQVSELWLKLLIHELSAAIIHVRSDALDSCQKIFARCKVVLLQLTEMWSVLETLTPSEYIGFRDKLGVSSGFQSLQYRLVEFLLGNKNASMLQIFENDKKKQAILRKALEEPSLYDEVLCYLGRHGYSVPQSCMERDWSQPHAFNTDLLQVFRKIYRNQDAHWGVYQLCEDLIDLENQFQLWRFRHMRAVMRIIGFRRGTGGSSGVGFLKKVLDMSFFPELFDVRTTIEPAI